MIEKITNLQRLEDENALVFESQLGPGTYRRWACPKHGIVNRLPNTQRCPLCVDMILAEHMEESHE